MRITFFSAAIFASSLATAATPVEGWYSSIFGGYAYIPNNVTNYSQGLFRNGTSYNGGFNAGGRVGFKSLPLRYEAEFTYIHANLGGFFVNEIKQFGVSGQFTESLGMANVYYDFPEMVPCVTPFISGGLGYAWFQARLASKGSIGGPLRPTSYKHANSSFGYQVSAGMMYNFAENYSIDVALRYVGTGRAGALGKVVQANLASANITYRFDESSYK